MELIILTRENIKTLIILAAALAAGFVVSSLNLPGLSEAGRITLGIFTTAAILWVMESFPLYVTSFIIVILEVVLLAREGGPLQMTGKEYTVFLSPFFDSVVVWMDLLTKQMMVEPKPRPKLLQS